MSSTLPKFKGKLIGAGLGLALGGPIGLLIGLMIGHLLTDLPEEKKARQRVHYSRHVYTQPGYGEFIFVSNLVALLTAMAKVDGEVLGEEVSVIRRFFQHELGYRGEELMLIKRLIKESIHTPLDITELCYQFRKNSNYQSRLLLLELLYKVAYADHKMSGREQGLVNRVAELIGILEVDHRRIAAQFKESKEEDYYKVLGVNSDAPVAEIKKAYRRLVQQYHPDKVNHLGEEYVKMAHQHLTEINHAYDYIRKQKGF